MSEDIFTSRYKALNKAQKEAVDAIEGPVMVIAGPGTGKTSILTLRIANILKRTDTPANGILAITYTDAGVKAMRAKLQQVIGDRAHDIRIHTFHSFASSIISEYPDHFLHLSDMEQMTDIDQELLVRSIISEAQFLTLRPTGKPDVYLAGILRSIDESKREGLTPEMVRKHAKSEIERIKNDESSISTRGITKGKLKADAQEAIEKCERTFLFADVYALYESRKKENDQMDFNDLIIELLKALREDELLLRLIQERYLYIHVDEHQDTNDTQNDIIRLIAEFFDTPNIFIVGDEKQAIYRFQGASVENFLLLQKKWPSMKLIQLDTNYRSHQSILDASFGMIEKNYADDEHSNLRIRLASGLPDKARPIEIITGENVSATEKYLVDALREIDPSLTVAIIVRRNKDLDRVIRLLESNHIPVSSERSVDIFSHPIGKLFFDFIEYLSDTSRVENLAQTIIAGMWNLSLDQSIILVKEISAGNYSHIEEKLPLLIDIKNKQVSDSPVGFLITTAQESGFTHLIAKDPSYTYVWRGIVTLAESLAREGDIQSSQDLMKAMLAYRMSADSRSVKVSVGAPNLPLRAMTAHGSKGLEFDYVFIPYATEDAWIGKPRGASFVLPKKQTIYSDISDTRRLFYVALTRARKHALVLTALEESDGKILTPLRFISELDQKHIINSIASQVATDMMYPSENTKISSSAFVLINAPTSAQQKIVDLAKHILVEKGLSVTALNHFLECPNKFIFQSVLKIPQIPNPSAEKGTAMHAALARVWKLPDRGLENIKETLTKVINDYFEKSLLSLVEKKSALHDLVEDIPAVSKALEPHFALSHNSGKQLPVLTESWVETEFKGLYEKKPIIVPLHGKLDAILDTGNEVSVFDYKTRKAMSVAAIKGETKNDDGNYFRQLVFYKMLVADDVRWKSRKITPALVFVSPDEKGRCPTVTLPIDEKDIKQVQSEVQLLVDSVWSSKIMSEKCSDQKCEWCGLRSIANW